MGAQQAIDTWLHDDTEEDLVRADWHQRAIRDLSAALQDLAAQHSWPWHVGDQLTLVGWKPDGSPWRPSPDIMIHPTAGPSLREEIVIREEGSPALIVEVASRTTWAYDVDIDRVRQGKAYGYLHVLRIPEYLIFDPMGAYVPGQCRGWRRIGTSVREWRPGAGGRYVSRSLGISFCPDGDLLRVFDPAGLPMPYIHEQTQRIAALDQQVVAQSQTIARQEQDLARLRAELARLRGDSLPSGE